MNKHLFSLLALFIIIFLFAYLSYSDGILNSWLFGQIGSVPPFTPLNLQTNLTNYNQINLSWQDDSDNESEFKIYRRVAYTGSWAQIAMPGGLSGRGAFLTYVDKDRPVGNYEYKVSACNSFGCSGDSNIAIISFAKDVIPPSAPGSLSIANDYTSSQANLTWTGSADNEGIKWYNIYRSPSSTTNFSIIASTTYSNYSDSSLAPSSQYYYQIRAVDLEKNISDPSNLATVTTLPIGGNKSLLRITYPNGGECFVLPGNLHVEWTGTGYNQAIVYYGGTEIFRGRDTTFNWYMTASVSPTTAGSVKITGLDDNGNSVISDTSDNPFTISLNCNNEPTTQASVPSTPTLFQASYIQDKPDIKLSWQDNSRDETEFRIYRRSLPNGNWKLIGITGQNTTSYTEVNVPPGDYEYDANACNQVGCSSYSNQFRITALASLPPDPTKIYEISELKSGDMISATNSNDPDVYIVNENGFKRLFLNEVIFNFYGHLGGFQNIKKVNSSTREYYQTSGIFRNCETDDPKIYGLEITGEDIGTLRWINTTGEQAVIDDPDFFKKVFCINNNEFNWYSKGLEYSSVNQIPSYSR